MLDSCVLRYDSLNIEEPILILLIKCIVSFLRLLFFIIILHLLLLNVLSVCQVELDFIFRNLRSLTKDKASDTLVNIEVFSQVLSHMPLQHELIVLLAEVLDHELVITPVDLR